MNKHPLPVRTYVNPTDRYVGLCPGAVANIWDADDNSRFFVAMSRSNPRGYGEFCFRNPLGTFIDVHRLWSLRRPELITYEKRYKTHAVKCRIHDRLREVLGLSEITWTPSKKALEEETWVRRGELVRVALDESGPPVPCIVVSDPMMTRETGDVVVLRTIDYRDAHDEPLGPGLEPPTSVFPITLPDDVLRTVDLTLLRSVELSIVTRWTPTSHVLGDEMTVIDERLEDMLVTPHS